MVALELELESTFRDVRHASSLPEHVLLDTSALVLVDLVLQQTRSASNSVASICSTRAGSPAMVMICPSAGNDMRLADTCVALDA